MSLESVMPSSHLVFSYPLLLLPSVFPTIRVFSNESALCTRRPKYWSFSFNISCLSEYSGLFSFRIDCFDLLAVQGTLKSLLQNHSLKASILVLFFLASITEHKFLISVKSSLSAFLMDRGFSVTSRNFLPKPRSWRFVFCFLLIFVNFCVFHLELWSILR